MADANKVSMELPGVDFAALARQVIAVEVSKVLSIPQESLNHLVAAALQEKVNSEGKRSHYDSDKTFVEWAARDAIRLAVLDLIKTRVEAMKPKLTDLIEVNLRKNAKAFAVVLSDNFVKSCASQSAYGFKLDITLNDRER